MNSNLIVYQNIMTTTMENMIKVVNEYRNQNQEIKDITYQVIRDLLNFAYQHNVSNNIWKSYIIHLLVNDENPFSLFYEKQTTNNNASLDDLVLHDFEIIEYLYSIDLNLIAKTLQIESLNSINSYLSTEATTSYYHQIISSIVKQLEVSKDFITIFKTFYQKYGVGIYASYKAFKIVVVDDQPIIKPIEHVKEIILNDLIGYQLQKEKLIANTESFIQHKKANNVLLFGDSGTGKSSSIKAVLNQYFEDGLRMIEIYKHQFNHLTSIISSLAKRNYKFIIYMDDLSFEETETEFKYLKAIIEGDLEETPNNVVIYATSNRRHLIKEMSSDNQENDDDLHRFDTKQEKLSLAQRFGITIYYGKPDKEQYQEIVKSLAQKYDVTIDEKTLLEEANQWEIYHGGMNGRNAEQFIYYLLSKYSYER